MKTYGGPQHQIQFPLELVQCKEIGQATLRSWGLRAHVSEA